MNELKKRIQELVAELATESDADARRDIASEIKTLSEAMAKIKESDMLEVEKRKAQNEADKLVLEKERLKAETEREEKAHELEAKKLELETKKLEFERSNQRKLQALEQMKLNLAQRQMETELKNHKLDQIGIWGPAIVTLGSALLNTAVAPRVYYKMNMKYGEALTRWENTNSFMGSAGRNFSKDLCKVRNH